MQTNVKAGAIRCMENKAGGLGQSPQPPEGNGVRGRSTRRSTILQLFSKKYAYFKYIVWSKFRVFK